jgi:hypothetical protein
MKNWQNVKPESKPKQRALAARASTKDWIAEKRQQRLDAVERKRKAFREWRPPSWERWDGEVDEGLHTTDGGQEDRYDEESMP